MSKKKPQELMKEFSASNTAAPDDDALAGLIEDSEGTVLDDVIETRQRSFKPWHRPRKHYLRIHQWCAEIRKLIPKLKLTGRALSYLSLPGDDMLDIRAIHGVCVKEDIPLRYLGFNNASPSHRDEANISHNELRSQGWRMIDQRSSEVVYDLFEATAVLTSMAYKELSERAPYDVVNIDLCNCIAAPIKKREVNTFDALKTLLDLQEAHRSEPWLLMLTTRTARGEGVDVRQWTKLCSVFDSNLKGAQFHQLCRESLGFTDEISLSDAAAKLGQELFSRSFVVALGKWLLNILNPSWEIELRPPAAYSVDGVSGLDMVSLVFKFSPRKNPLEDRSGLTTVKTRIALSRPTADEEQQACQLISVASKIVDVDALLQSDGDLLTKVLRQSESLMTQARYEASLFREWVDRGCPLTGP